MKILEFLFVLFLISPQRLSAQDDHVLCGSTWNTLWTIQYLKPSIKLISKKFFTDKHCEAAETPANANLIFELLDDKKEILFSKEIYVAKVEFYDETFDDKKMSGGASEEMQSSFLVKYPDALQTRRASYFRFRDKYSGKSLGELRR